MLDSPPGSGHINNWNIGKAEYSQHCADRRPTGAVCHSSQNQIGSINQGQHERGRQPGVPRPPDPPFFVTPERASDHTTNAVNHAYLRCKMQVNKKQMKLQQRRNNAEEKYLYPQKTFTT